MSKTETDILKSLLELEETVHMVAKGEKKDLISIFAKIDRLARQLPSETDPRLLHYLHKRSYEKARLWLQGRDPENPESSPRHL